MQEYIEGSARIRVRKGVFLNPKMSGLRDLSVLFLKAAAPKDSMLLDSTAATGIRAIRYSKEAGIKRALLLDINDSAAKNARSNVAANKLNFEVRNASIQEFASSARERFDIIDLDPFGSPAPNIYDLFKVSKDNGILMITATDTAVLCGAHYAACIKTYAAKPLHNFLCKEVGIRILAGYVARTAAQFNYGIELLLSVSDLHYMRIFIRVKAGANGAVDSVKKTGFCSYCSKCSGFSCYQGIAPAIGKECRYCGAPTETAGPMWLSSLCNKDIVKTMEKNASSADARRQLKVIRDEPDLPFFYSVANMTKLMKMGSVSPNAIMKKLSMYGFKASSTQFERDCIKTDASPKDMVKAVRQALKV